MNSPAGRGSRTRTSVRIAMICAVILVSAVSGAHADPSSPPATDAEKLAAAGPWSPVPGPGPYGSGSYYSSDAEEADLQAVGDLAASVKAIGAARTGIDSMLIRVPLGASIPKDTMVGTFSVHFEQSRFTAGALAALNEEIVKAGEAAAAAGEQIAFASGYEAEQDLLVVHGTAPESLIALANSRSGLSIAGDAAPGDGRTASRVEDAARR